VRGSKITDIYALCGKFLLFLIVLISLTQVSLGSEKTDTVFLKNGDRITGEVKRLEYGILFLKTSGLGTINIEFDRIKTFYSKERFTILLSNGLRFFGTIDTSGIDGQVILKVNEFRIPKPIIEIVEIYPVKNIFWKRLDGSIDIGYSYTKATTISKFDFKGRVDYRVEKAYSEIKLEFTLTDQQDKERIRKQDVVLSHRRLIKRKWFGAGALGAQQNSELGVDCRYGGGPAIGIEIIHSNANVLNGLGGLLLTTEKSAADSIINSVELLLMVDYRLFKFNNPDIDIRSNLNAYPSLTTANRIRIEYSLDAKFEVFKDFYFGVRLYYNYDSKPIDPTAANDDWGITTSIGYSW